ncbi:MAG: fatty acid desaturase [Pseudomonadota bacterium]|nr:fatty acid desaturase [Pseudomonadota bacterium]
MSSPRDENRLETTAGLPRPQRLHWKDLVALRRHEIILNLGLSAPWLGVSLWAAQQGYFLLAIPCSAAFFLTALRQAHDSYHASIGVPRPWLDTVLLMLTLTMLCATHAIRHTHLEHHKNPLGKGDAEGCWARQSAWRALLLGPLFSIRIHAQALQTGSASTRRWTWAELALVAGVWLLAVLTQQDWLRYHVATMMAANALVGFFAVWSVHHGCEAQGVFARTERRAWCNRLTVNLLYHVEHHLFPAVPANHLPALALRLDRAAPEWTRKPVLGKPPGAARRYPMPVPVPRP